MAKLTLLLACVTLGLFGSTKSASFECEFKTGGWGTLGTVYVCYVQNSVSITSTDAAQIDSISGAHLAGYNNDNVEAFRVYDKGQIHYFPRGLDKIFKNLKGIKIVGTGLKEIHQSDLKVFPKLTNLYLYDSNLEILEENLFEFNPNLDNIYLYYNKISHIDPNVFDKLTKLKTLDLDSNTCIDMNADNNSTAVQNIIRIVKSQCTSSDYSNLEQKVKYLEAESKSLNSEKFKKSFENLENEVKNSKFSRFFQSKFESLKAIKIEKEVPEKIANLDEKLTAMSKEMSNLKNDVLTVKNAQPANIQNLGRIQNLVNDQSQKTESKFTTIDGKLVDVKAEMSNLKNDILTVKNAQPANIQKLDEIQNLVKDQNQKTESKFTTIDGKLVDVNQKIQELSQHITKGDEAASKFSKDTTTTLKDIEASNSQNFAAIMNFIENLSKKMEAIEVKLAGIDSTQKKVMNKILNIESDSNNNKVEINKKLKDILYAVY